MIRRHTFYYTQNTLPLKKKKPPHTHTQSYTLYYICLIQNKYINIKLKSIYNSNYYVSDNTNKMVQFTSIVCLLNIYKLNEIKLNGHLLISLILTKTPNSI